MMKYAVRIGIAVSLLGMGSLATGCSEPAGAVAAPAAPAATADAAVMHFADAMARGDLHVAWDGLPASYQKDLADLVHTFAAKTDADVWNAGFALVGQSADMLENQKGLIIEMMSAKDPSFDAPKVGAEWNRVLAPFQTIAKSDLAKIETLKTMDVRAFLGTTGSRFMKDLQALAELNPEGDNPFVKMRTMTATLISENGDTAEVRIHADGSDTTETFTRVEGKWIPADMAAEWKGEMARARENLGRMSTADFEQMKPQVMALIGGLNSTIEQLNQAETAQQFEMTAQMGMMQAFGGIMALNREARAMGQ